MKKFDYFCIVYSVALLIFGFSDDVPKQKSAVRAIDSTTKAGGPIAAGTFNQTRPLVYSISMAPITQKPSAQMQTFVATK